MDEQTITDIAEIRKIPKDGRFWASASYRSGRCTGQERQTTGRGIMDSGGSEGKVWQDAQWFDKRARQVAVQNPWPPELRRHERLPRVQGTGHRFKGSRSTSFSSSTMWTRRNFRPTSSSGCCVRSRSSRSGSGRSSPYAGTGGGLLDTSSGGLWEKFSGRRRCPAHHAYVGGLRAYRVHGERPVLSRDRREIGYDVPVPLLGRCFTTLGRSAPTGSRRLPR